MNYGNTHLFDMMLCISLRISVPTQKVNTEMAMAQEVFGCN